MMINPRRRLLGQTFVLLLGVRIGLACLSFQRLRSFQSLRNILLWLSRSATPESDDPAIVNQSIRQIIWSVERSATLMPGGAKCLAKALTTQVLMDRRGHPCEFKLGVAKNEQGELEAHAWIEREGQVIMGFLPDLDRFTCLPSL